MLLITKFFINNFQNQFQLLKHFYLEQNRTPHSIIIIMEEYICNLHSDYLKT